MLRTDLVQLENLVVGAELGQQLLAGFAVRAVALAEDGDAVVVDDALGLGLGGGHACWTGWSGEGEEGSDEGRNCGGGCRSLAIGWCVSGLERWQEEVLISGYYSMMDL